MNNTTKITSKSTISFEVIRLITLYFFALAIVLIIAEVFFEYHNIKHDIDERVENLISSFQKPLANSLWEMNQIQTDTIITGIIDSPYVLAVKLYDSEGNITFNSAESIIPTKESPNLIDFYFNPDRSFSYDYELSNSIVSNNNESIGKISIFSGNKVILDQLSRIIFYIITNSILQTITLWIILIFFINSKVRDPLNELLLKIKNTDPQDPNPIDSSTKYNAREFSLIVNSFNKLISELRKFKDVLEAIVENKTEMLKEKNIEVHALLNKLENAQHQLINQEKLNSLGLVSAGIAHELKNPLNISLNSIIILRDILNIQKNQAFSIDRISEKKISKLPEIIDLIQNSQIRMESIIKNMLLQSRTEYTKPAQINLDAFINMNLKIVQKSLKTKASTLAVITTDIDKNLEISVFPNEFGRLLVNLFENAFYALAEKLKESSSKGTMYSPEIRVSTSIYKSDKILISIHDNGIGIKEEVIDKVLEPFFTTKPPGMGTGLGLHLAYDIVKKHHGEIKINSEVDVYTEFQIILPLSIS